MSLTGTQEPETKRRFIAYRPNDLMMCNTNNGTETLNEGLKYDDLVGYKNCTLISLLQVLIKNVNPKYFEMYIELKVKYIFGFWKYQKEIPQYWQNRSK